MIAPSLIAKARTLCLDVAPELKSVPFYTLSQPVSFPNPRETTAYAIIGRNLALRDLLRSSGEWLGAYGPTIVFVDPPSDRESFLALSLHEASHCLPAISVPDIEATVDQRERQEQAVLAWAAAPPIDYSATPWRGHGIRFIRRLLHLHYRALWAGVPLPLSSLNCAGAMYELSPAWRYLSALGAEPFDLRRRTFAEIQAVPPPAEFQQLFVGDVAAWNDRQTKQQQEH